MKIVLLGAGKLAHHLGPAFVEKGIEIVAVYNRSLDRARQLAPRLGGDVMVTDRLFELPKDADFYLLAVADQAIAELARQLSGHLGPNLPLVHTSGATPSEVLRIASSRYGVFYPFQSFSPGRKIDFEQIPLSIYSQDQELLALLRAVAEKLSRQVYRLDDQQRAQLHVAGVFANNFVNHLIGQSHDLLAKANIPKPILFNLIRETIEKLEQQDADSAQTGPAIRGDSVTIEKHLALLETNPAARAVYQLITQQIKSTNSTNQQIAK